jgi:hypothetical protein
VKLEETGYYRKISYINTKRLSGLDLAGSGQSPEKGICEYITECSVP